jgi:hypothetical protein
MLTCQRGITLPSRRKHNSGCYLIHDPKENIPVEVDAIVFYKVANVEASVLKVDDYHMAT